MEADALCEGCGDAVDAEDLSVEAFEMTARLLCRECWEAMAQIIPLHPRPIVDITGCASGVRVWVRGVPFEDFATLSNAARCASALMTLEALGLLDRVLDVQDVVRGMLPGCTPTITR
jgi:hypothetical protein